MRTVGRQRPRDALSQPLLPAGLSERLFQLVWHSGEPVLIRNYDYAPWLCEGALLLTAWNGRRVMAMSDCAWGVLDGMNEDGLAVSLSFGGRRALGVGFGVPLLLRYVLEFCTTVAEAAEAITVS